MSPAHSLHLSKDLIAVGLSSEELHNLCEVLWEIHFKYIISFNKIVY